jgi:outer membrane protein OmpA-like peptidoglycan-associated protein
MRCATAIVVVWLLASVQRAPVDAQAAQSGASSAQVPLATGLNFTITAHGGLVAGTGSVPIADTEIVYSVVDSDNDRISFRFSVSAPNDAAAGKLLDSVPHSFGRTVRREDLRAATRLTVLLNSEDPALLPGQTFASTSGAVLRALHDTGKTAFTLGVNEPDQGLAALANLASGGRLAVGGSGGSTGSNGSSGSSGKSGAPIVAAGVTSMLSLSVVRHYYRGTLERVGTADEPFSVLLDGRRTTVPAMHVRGALAFADRTIAPQMWWLDDANNPLTLKWMIANVYETVTRIDRPNGDQSGAARAVADGLAKSCRAELSGVYFTTASAQVLDASMPALERFAAVMSARADWRVTIEGHTDNIGSADYNLDLSTRRAAAVRDVLTGRFGVPAARLLTKGYGLTRPVETNATDEGRAHNRRVEVSRPCNTT